MPRISIIGSYTGRNAGDAAILENIVRDIAEVLPNVQCEVLTVNPAFIRDTYADLPLEAVPTLPWNLSIKSLGLPLLRSVLRSDAVIVTSAILFDRKFWNPLYNYLTSLLLALPLARRLGKKVFFYSVGVGPVYTAKGRKIVRYLLDHSDGVTLREEASIAIMHELGVHIEPVLAADPALNQRLSPEMQREIGDFLSAQTGEGPRIAINLNAYLDTWVGERNEATLTRPVFVREMGRVVRHVIEQWGWSAILICTHYMDEGIVEEVAKEAGREASVFVMSNRHYNHRQLMAAMAASELMIGMRLHCQILAVAAGTPCVALNYAPKVRHFMEMVGLDEYTVELTDFSAERVLECAEKLKADRDEVKPRLTERVGALQAQAKRAAVELARLF
ncbi:MAG: polysaccharide pyruvyl transferase family protein [Candidatus Hydrogenedentota bacterium]